MRSNCRFDSDSNVGQKKKERNAHHCHCRTAKKQKQKNLELIQRTLQKLTTNKRNVNKYMESRRFKADCL